MPNRVLSPSYSDKMDVVNVLSHDTKISYFCLAFYEYERTVEHSGHITLPLKCISDRVATISSFPVFLCRTYPPSCRNTGGRNITCPISFIKNRFLNLGVILQTLNEINVAFCRRRCSGQLVTALQICSTEQHSHVILATAPDVYDSSPTTRTSQWERIPTHELIL